MARAPKVTPITSFNSASFLLTGSFSKALAAPRPCFKPCSSFFKISSSVASYNLPSAKYFF